MPASRLHGLKQILLVFALCLFSFAAKSTAYYWVGDGGSWMDYSQHWATTSGGAVFHSQVPGPNDDVIFDANSFSLGSQHVTTNTDSIICKSMIWIGVTNNPTFGDINSFYYTVLKVYGSMLLNPAMSWEFSGRISFESLTTGNTINSYNLNGMVEVHFNSATGSWLLTNDFTCTNLFLDRGILRTGNNDVSCLNNIETISNAPVTFLCGTSHITADHAIHVNSNLLTIDGDSAVFQTGEFNTRSNQSYKKIIICGPFPLTIIGTAASVDSVEIALTTDSFALNTNNSVFRTFISRAHSTLFFTNTFRNGIFYKNIITDANNTFDTLSLFNVGYYCKLKNGSFTTINNTIISGGGCTGTVLLRSTSSASQANIIKSSGTLTTSNILLRDINAGGGGTFIANNSYSISNVSGWTVNNPLPRTLYWVGNTGNWNDPAHWSLLSGGPGGNCIPGNGDDVIFNSFSFSSANDSLYLNVGQANCKTMSWSGVTLPVTVWNNQQAFDNLGVYGSFLLPSTLNWEFAGKITFGSSMIGTSLQTSGNILSYTLLDGTGSWIIADSLHCSTLELQAGNLFSLGRPLHFQFFKSNSTLSRSIRLRTSVVNCQDWYINGSNMIIDVDSSIIYAESIRTYITANYGTVFLRFSTEYPSSFPTCRLDGTGSSFKYVEGRDQIETYGFSMSVTKALFKEPINLGGGFMTFGKMECRKDLVSDISFFADTVLLNNTTYTVTFGSATNINANYFLTTSNSCAGYITIQSDDPLNEAQLNVPFGTVNCNYVILNGIHAGGGATFNAISSVILTNVAGWNIISAPTGTTYYWVGGQGNWSDGMHWAATSGGIGGMCTPTSLDHIIFDANSFIGLSDTVFINLSSAYCNNMTWQSIVGNPVVSYPGALSSSNALFIYGNLILHNNVIWDYTGKLAFTGPGTTKTIRTAGVLLNEVYFNYAAGTWTLWDSLSCEMLFLQSGYLKTSGFNLYVDFFSQINDSIQLGTSCLKTQYFANNSSDQEFSADSSVIVCNFFEGYGQHYNLVNMEVYPPAEFYGQDCIIRNFSALATVRFITASNNTFQQSDFAGRAEISGSHTFGKANFHDAFTILGNNSFDTLLLNNPGDSVILGSSAMQTVNNILIVNSFAGSPIGFYSSLTGTSADLACNGVQECLEYTSFQDVNANGIAPFFAGDFSTDMGNNSGINFAACPLPSSDVWPGDTNEDLIVDNDDILNIGIAYPTTGLVRNGASLSYVAQNCTDWSSAFINNVNFNHADCNGNGIIDSTDLAAVHLNYGLTHTVVIPVDPPPIPTLTSTDLFLDPVVNYYSPLDFVTIPVKLGTSAIQASNLYGLSYDITYDNTKITNGSVYMTYPSTWFTPNGNRISFQRDNFAAGKIDNGQTRIDTTDISGDGTIAYLHLQISSTAFGTVLLDISGITAVDHLGNTFSLIPTGTTLYVGPLSASQQNSFIDLQVFPNPSNGNSTLTYSISEKQNVVVEISDACGKLIYSEEKTDVEAGEHSLLLPTEKFAEGIYYCRFKAGEITQTIKLVKTE